MRAYTLGNLQGKVNPVGGRPAKSCAAVTRPMRHAARQRSNADAVEAHLPCALCLAGITNLLQVPASSCCGDGTPLTGSLQRDLADLLARNGQPSHCPQSAARLPWQGIDEAIIHQMVLQGQWHNVDSSP